MGPGQKLILREWKVQEPLEDRVEWNRTSRNQEHPHFQYLIDLCRKKVYITGDEHKVGTPAHLIQHNRSMQQVYIYACMNTKREF